MPGKSGPSDRRFYTVAEANTLLPEVRRLLQELRRAVAGLDELKARLLEKQGGSGELPKPEPDTRVDPDHLLLIGLFHHSLSRFNDLCLEVKDVSRGLVDFPCKAGGEEVWLCWLDGEDAVRFFHDGESGFAGRKPVEELPGGGAFPTPRDDEGGEEEG